MSEVNYSMVLFIIALIAAVIIGVIIHKKGKEKKKLEKPKEGNLIVSESFLSNADSTPIVNNNHVVSQLYFHKSEDGLWTCPYCECENSTRESFCTVCFSARKE